MYDHAHHADADADAGLHVIRWCRIGSIGLSTAASHALARYDSCCNSSNNNMLYSVYIHSRFQPDRGLESCYKAPL